MFLPSWFTSCRSTVQSLAAACGAQPSERHATRERPGLVGPSVRRFPCFAADRQTSLAARRRGPDMFHGKLQERVRQCHRLGRTASAPLPRMRPRRVRRLLQRAGERTRPRPNVGMSVRLRHAARNSSPCERVADPIRGDPASLCAEILAAGTWNQGPGAKGAGVRRLSPEL